MLDGRAVGLEEPQQAVQALRHEEVLMALMLSNACLVHKLVCYHNWLHRLDILYHQFEWIYCNTLRIPSSIIIQTTGTVCAVLA